MLKLLIAAATASQFTLYPSFRMPDAQVDAYTDKGLTYELVIRCPSGPPAILSFSKVDALYCGPDHSCTPSLDVAIDDACH